MADSALPSIITFSENVAEAEAPPPLPVSEYIGEIRKVEIKESQSGNKYAAVTFYIGTDQFPADFDVANAPDGKTLSYNRVVVEDNPQARFRLRKFIEAIGAKAGKQVDVNEWVGLSAKLEIKHETYEGIVREAIERVKAVA